MSVTHTIVRSCVKAAGVAGLAITQTVTGDFENNVSILIPAQTGSPLTGANFQINRAYKRSKLQHIEFQASRTCTVYTNAPSSGSPQDTIPLTAVTDINGNLTGEVESWVLAGDGIARCPFSGDVTVIYVTPPVGGADTLFQILAIENN